ncbi:ABC transporter ATP-binding protein [Paenibacillus sp. F411]|uniref:ABC transporter ATP-binding protein n=1 Tax=Paenibacillus sp. F411 TaxID=2820239 RepID=UPI001AAEBA5A|nr:ABC transporter ATP-binding protein [Paenibacillus sp. F411]MBO2945230.1 ABC transporter ATP-binding protein [Paenibacillus sp. F411]
MDIHEEAQLKKVKDSLLWRKMMRFAIPYRKRIAGSFVLAMLIAALTVAQPLLVKNAIDERIHGIFKPMIATDSSIAPADLAPVVTGDAIPYEDRMYYRVDAKDLTESVGGESVQRAQIVAYQDQYYVLNGWVERTDELTFIPAASGMEITAPEGRTQLVEPMTDSQVRAFRVQDVSGFITIGVLFLISVVLAGVFTYWQSILLQTTGQHIIRDLRVVMFEHLAKLQTSFYDRNPVGRLVTRVAYDVEAVNQLFSQVIVNLAKELLLLIGIAAIMLHLDVSLALVSFAMIPLLIVITIYFKKVIRESQRLSRIMLSKLNSFLAESLSGMSIVQIFTREKKQLEQFVGLNDAHYQAGMKATVNNSLFNPLIGLFGNLALALIVWYGGGSVLAATVTFGVVYAFTTYVRQFFQPLMALSDRYTQIQMALTSAERIFELLEEQPAIMNSPHAKEVTKPLQGSIAFDKVWFTYEADDWVLKNISFEVKPGETVAFVGSTGAGKSSIIQLINRFYDIQKGSICLDGKPLDSYALTGLRQSVGVIQQDPFVFTGNVYENIRLNRTDISDEEITLAAKALHMDSFIQQLPQQYETMLGERGIKLSSGQQQLLSFLRVYVNNPDILILDEATAHVDTETEQTLQAGLLEMSKGKTTLIVAHRLSTIRHADKIIVLHKGEIKEVGTHHALLQQKGVYRKLYDLQNKEHSLDAMPHVQ